MASKNLGFLLLLGGAAFIGIAAAKDTGKSKDDCLDKLSVGIVASVQQIKAMPGPAGGIQRSFMPIIQQHLRNLGLNASADCLEALLTSDSPELPTTCKDAIKNELLATLRDGTSAAGKAGLPVLHQWLLAMNQKEAADCLTQLTGFHHE